MTRGANWIKSQGDNWYKMLQNGQITDFGVTLNQTLSPIMSGTKSDRDKQFFLQKDEVNKIELGI